ncbi:hypothetical protein CMI47_07400 [Candidatus Pacearchaeota archaeon]|jgi:uncharacterized protein (DUF3820 family)|nr:hypothetical protein [Candidatus Pacearchaeota archaeon]|tara:strand:+ start:134 stop:541 length:408 start_codon:yes stop_codon:yes gene_type:complete
MAKLNWQKAITTATIKSQQSQRQFEQITNYDIIKTKLAMIQAGTITFGKYTGKLLKDTPTSYLEWAKKKLTKINKQQKQAIKDELKARNLTHKVSGPDNNSAEILVNKITTQSQASLKHHTIGGCDVKRNVNSHT